MTILKSLIAAIEAEHWRYLSGTDKGILRSIGQRDELTDEDFEYGASIIRRLIEKEGQVAREGREQDAGLELKALALVAAHSPEELERMASGVDWLGHEIVGDRRSTSRAVAAEGRRSEYDRKLPIREALKLAKGDFDD